VILDTPLSLFSLSIVLFAVFLSIKPPLSYIRIIIYLMGTTMIAAVISQGFFYYFEPRTPIFTVVPSNTRFFGNLTGGIYFYKEGVIYGAIQSMRIFSATLLSMVIVVSTYPSDLILGLKKLGIPEKLGFIITVSIRFLPTLGEEAKRILIAQKLRGLRLKGICGALNGFRFLLQPLIIDSLRKAKRIALAAEVRGFTGKRVEIRSLRFLWADRVVLFIAFLTMLFVIRKMFCP
jgi:energy-coupling factor transport system permease protein